MLSRRLSEPEDLGLRSRVATLGLIPVVISLVACASMPSRGGPQTASVERPSKRRGVIDVAAGTCPPGKTCETFLDDLDNQLHAHDIEIRNCYARYGLSVDSELEVRAFVEIRTDAQQRVLVAQPANGTSVEICLAEIMTGWTLACADPGAPQHFMMRVPLSKDDLGVEGDASPLTPERVAATVRGRIPLVRNCYQRALKRRPELKGRIVIDWTINRGGRVSLSRVTEDTLRDDEATACILHRVLEMTFVAPSGPVDVSFPFVFQTVDGV